MGRCSHGGRCGDGAVYRGTANECSAVSETGVTEGLRKLRVCSDYSRAGWDSAMRQRQLLGRACAMEAKAAVRT